MAGGNSIDTIRYWTLRLPVSFGLIRFIPGSLFSPGEFRINRERDGRESPKSHADAKFQHFIHLRLAGLEYAMILISTH